VEQTRQLLEKWDEVSGNYPCVENRSLPETGNRILISMPSSEGRQTKKLRGIRPDMRAANAARWITLTKS
jgi:hypothetical protein